MRAIRTAFHVFIVFLYPTSLWAQASYPPSPVIRDIEWAPVDSIVCKAEGGDNWPVTWAGDALFTTYGDGWGFDPKVPDKLSLGFARVTGPPDRFEGINVRSPDEQFGDGRAGKKAWGALSLGDVLYLWLGHADLEGGEAQLAWSHDGGQTWTFAPWRFPQFGLIGFVNYGQDYQGARDAYVYAYSHDGPRADTPADHFVLMRAPKDRVTQKEAWEFWSYNDEQGDPVWTQKIDERGAVFVHPDAALRSGMTYNAALQRYLWWQQIPAPPGSADRGDTRFEGGFGIYDAPEPWGPWTTVLHTDGWDVGPGEHGDFPSKWMSEDGREVHLVFSGDDAFCVRKATLRMMDEPASAQASLHYINTAFENASPLYWETVGDTVVVHLVYDHERDSPNRANGHWHFQVQAEPGTRLTLAVGTFYNIYNGRPSNPIRGDHSRMVVSENGADWRSIPAKLDEQRRLVADIQMEGSSLYVASVEPYRIRDLEQVLDEIRPHPLVQIDTIGHTVEARPLEMIRVGSPDAPNRVLIRARAHPWEPGGNWVVQGLIRSLLADEADNARYLERYAVYILPMANKDGVARGRTRFNLQGVDLNRGWETPADPALAPENAALEAWLEEMIRQDRKPDLAFELHNDKEGQLHITKPADSTSTYPDRMQRLEILLSTHTWFTEGSRVTMSTGTLGAGLLNRYGIDALVYELNADWIEGLQEPASGAHWQTLGSQLRAVLFDYFEP